MRKIMLSPLVAAIALASVPASTAVAREAKGCAPVNPATTMTRGGVESSTQYECPPPGGGGGGQDGGSGGAGGASNASAAPPVRYEIKTVKKCDDREVNCQDARQTGVCEPTDPITTVYSRVVGEGPSDWDFVSTACGEPGPDEIAAMLGGRQPNVPSEAQIQRAFESLPFSKPSVKIQPEGTRTLINLDTYYRAEWPKDSGLAPGEVSKPVKLLSWKLEYKVEALEYRYVYGDGSTSEWTTSPGGTYPEGDVIHKYDKTGSYDVRVDARLTGQFRANGGQWQDIDSFADLANEPVTTIQALGTKTRLVEN